MDRGGHVIETWVDSCVHCGHDVAVTAEAARITCGSCKRTFDWAGQPSTDTPTRKIDSRKKAPSDPNDSMIGTTLGRWTLTRLIGQGGMGRVYEARGGLMNRKVALKLLSEDLAEDASFVKRFHREAKLLSSLSHPHVVDVIDRGEDKGHLWFAMDYVRGESLRKLMDRGPISHEQAARIAMEIAEALSYAHTKGIIHRDLKPENVLLDERGSVHLVDFGLSRLVGGEADLATTRLTRTDVILGTYEYMAPEQRRGDRKLDGRSDVFALGVILYEMLTGQLPLGRFTMPSQFAGVPRAFDDVVDKALASHAKDRFAGARPMREALRVAMDKTPATGAPPPLPGNAPAHPVVPHHEVESARSLMRHAEILGALDRVLGLLFVLSAFGIAAGVLSEIIQLPWVGGFGFVVSLILGLYLMSLGRRVGNLEAGARESQVMVSIVMLFFPPFLTAMGLYGLIAMTSQRARSAFRLGKKALGSRTPVAIQAPRVVHLSPPVHAKSASFMTRAYGLLAILFSLYVGFQGLELLGIAKDGEYRGLLTIEQMETLSSMGDLHYWIMGAAVLSLLVMIRMFLIRKQRRGFGLALVAFFFLWSAAAFFNTALDEAREHTDGRDIRSGAVHRQLPRTLVRHVPPILQWENSK
ncbi:MAG: serine/threonine-protein kinase [Planctomycetota bacterium]|nr:serine/threonine-protein kinase [Planctomycetota bacterium]